jgi:uncharacterized protein
MKIIAVHLTPKASSNRIEMAQNVPTGEEQLRVYVTAVAEKGKANKAMMHLLARHFHVAISRVRIVQGVTNRNKLIKIEE